MGYQPDNRSESERCADSMEYARGELEKTSFGRLLLRKFDEHKLTLQRKVLNRHDDVKKEEIAHLFNFTMDDEVLNAAMEETERNPFSKPGEIFRIFMDHLVFAYGKALMEDTKGPRPFVSPLDIPRSLYRENGFHDAVRLFETNFEIQQRLRSVAQSRQTGVRERVIKASDLN